MSVSPKARTEGLVIEWVDDELVVYDQVAQTAHCLSSVAASVWECCDGSRSSAEMAESLALQPAAVELALDQLRGCGLLDVGPASHETHSRRQALTRFAKVGGAAFTTPLIYSVAVGSAAAAASACLANGSTESGCTAASGSTATDAKCCSGRCYHSSGGTKRCVSATCALGGELCLLSGAGCCSGACLLLVCIS